MGRLTRICILICVNFLAFLSFTFSSSAQVSVPLDSLISPKVPYRLTKNASKLTEFLIQGKTSDKEKFDAIFSWVASNISYNYRALNSKKGNKTLTIHKILRKRLAVCGDYAHLMDTLCGLAGLQNTTVEGYTKPLYFDVNDSLYFSRHAWNAVKLESKWYLYDVTWSSKEKVYQYTRFGLWRLKMLKKILKHQKTTFYTWKFKNKKDKFCGIPEETVLISKQIMYLPKGYYFFYQLINFFPYRLRFKYNYVKNTDYYLTEPEVFSLDHFPEDPIWSFSYNVRTLDDFRKDSTYYYGIDSYFKNQHREGRTCIECDDFLSLDSLQKAHYLIKLGKEILPQNSLLSAESEMNVAEIYSGKFNKETDSTAKMAFYDSTLNYINLSKKDYREGIPVNVREYRFQSAKNKAKQQQLKRENKSHSKAIRSVFQAINGRKKKMSSLEYKSEANESSEKTAIRKFNRSFISKTVPKLKEQKIKSLQSMLEKYLYSSDSLSTEIVLTRDSLLNHSIKLLNALYEQDNVLSPYEDLFLIDGMKRRIHSLDSYDYSIRSGRKQIDSLENRFLTTVQDSVLNRADTMYATFMDLYKLIKKRNDYNVKAAKIITTLSNVGVINKDSVLVFKNVQNERMKQDVCWNRDQKSIFSSLKNNFESFYYQQKRFQRIISKNNSQENKRFAHVKKVIDRDNAVIKSVIEANTDYLKRMRKIVGKKREAYLKKLKKGK